VSRSSILNVTFDCSDAEIMARFWSEVTRGPRTRLEMPGNPFWWVVPIVTPHDLTWSCRRAGTQAQQRIEFTSISSHMTKLKLRELPGCNRWVLASWTTAGASALAAGS